MKNTTLLFLIKKENGLVTNICLAMKKRGFGVGKWNGCGGKLENSETIEQAVIRETKEEIGVIPSNFYKVAEISFLFPYKPDWDQLCHVYFCNTWNGDPIETDEMNPEWFSVSEIPFNKMWSDDIFWLPKVIEGSSVKAVFSFDEDNLILDQEIKFIELL